MSDSGNTHPWVATRWFTPSGGMVAETVAGVGPEEVFRHLARHRHVLFFDSALVDAPAADGGDAPAPPRLGRFSFVSADPIQSVEIPQTGSAADDGRHLAAAFAGLRTLLGDLACPTIPGLPPFQGGVAGFLSYEAGLARLGVAGPPGPTADVPLVSLHFYDVVYGFDHDLGRGWFISQGVPARGPAARRERAEGRLRHLLAGADDASGAGPNASGAVQAGPAAVATGAVATALPPGTAAPLAGWPGVYSTHAPAAYLDMVRAAVELIRAGDVFQVNLAQRFAVAAAVDPVALHTAARAENPAPFAGFFATAEVAIASMSPERLVQVSHGVARMHPIKGTRQVLASPEADLYAADELGGSDKDRAENVMIVDLIRNDLARVCRPESVRVESLCRLERYRFVHHLVSIVAGRLRPGLGALDLLEAVLPGGSVTGAPKHRACEIISDLEPAARGAYCGSLGYLGCDGSADWSLLIRTFVVTPGRVTFSAGGGITAASDPAAEYAESLAKAQGMLRVLATLGLAAAAEAAR